jgi:ubiquinone/menaquinone biosynthesis C-methylase UbiE
MVSERDDGLATTSQTWKEQAHAVFEKSAERYASEREQEHGFRAQLEIVLRMLAGESGCVLDVGCAAGAEIAALRARAFRVVGVEFSAAMLEHAQRRFASDPCVELYRGDAESLPFRSESFDHVICLGVLEYLPDYRPALREISRVLRPGGVAVFSIPSGISQYYVTSLLVENTLGPPWRRLKRLAGQKPPATGLVPHHSRNLCIPWRFRRLLRNLQLIPVDSAFSNFFIYPLDRLWPAGHARAAMFLERCSTLPLVGWTACQYLVSARKAST